MKQGNCHPFYDADTGTWFAHNGVLRVQPYKDSTDSEAAFRKLFVPYIRRYGLNAAETRETIMQVRANSGSKFAFMQGDDVRLFGDFIMRDGLYFSNLRWQWYVFA